MAIEMRQEKSKDLLFYRWSFSNLTNSDYRLADSYWGQEVVRVWSNKQELLREAIRDCINMQSHPDGEELFFSQLIVKVPEDIYTDLAAGDHIEAFEGGMTAWLNNVLKGSFYKNREAACKVLPSATLSVGEAEVFFGPCIFIATAADDEKWRINITHKSGASVEVVGMGTDIPFYGSQKTAIIIGDEESPLEFKDVTDFPLPVTIQLEELATGKSRITLRGSDNWEACQEFDVKTVIYYPSRKDCLFQFSCIRIPEQGVDFIADDLAPDFTAEFQESPLEEEETGISLAPLPYISPEGIFLPEAKGDGVEYKIGFDDSLCLQEYVNDSSHVVISVSKDELVIEVKGKDKEEYSIAELRKNNKLLSIEGNLLSLDFNAKIYEQMKKMPFPALCFMCCPFRKSRFDIPETQESFIGRGLPDETISIEMRGLLPRDQVEGLVTDGASKGMPLSLSSYLMSTKHASFSMVNNRFVVQLTSERHPIFRLSSIGDFIVHEEDVRKPSDRESTELEIHNFDFIFLGRVCFQYKNYGL